LAPAIPAAPRAAINNTEPMKINRIDAITFRPDLHIGGGSGAEIKPEIFRNGDAIVETIAKA